VGFRQIDSIEHEKLATRVIAEKLKQRSAS
jgi:hypothetical protein